MEKPSPGALEGQSTDTLDFKIAAFFPLKLFLQGLGTSRDEEDGHHASGYEIQLHKSWGCLSACPQRYLQWEKPSLTRRLGANSKPQSTQVTEVTGT